MAKNKNKKEKNGAAPMDFSADASGDLPQAMDTSETKATNPASGVLNRKVKKAIPMKRSKSRRKMKAIEKAISQIEKSESKILKNESKISRTHSAKKLYE
ncbi:PREDICTED: uncharacterized protein LOC104612606 [Nelumbo nucifera]|uniref:Uncharacterized protein n=2 Tax=Nelumbo nucifera TaxID=4432 RepID=A0A822XH48_NELNU|nr:PREDICTED: uncharacterized protein LOC104612606 [Nelumbo nucifera]DAD20804.1 TPA_asm: hypothetical protein HUJ06_022267 [Nelumbo nucifera]